MESILLSKKLISTLQDNLVNTLHPPDRVRFPYNSAFKPPCSFKWITAEHSIELGAFSYAVSGYFFACRIGRYCSLGEQVQAGRHSHPLSFASTSPIFYLSPGDVIGITNHSTLNEKPAACAIPPTAAKTTTIENDVYVGHGAFIMPGVTIGTGAVVGACAVVTKDVPPYAIVAGSPATIKRFRFDEITIKRLLESEWWKYPPSSFRDTDPSKPMHFIDRVNQLRDQNIEAYDSPLILLKDIA